MLQSSGTSSLFAHSLPALFGSSAALLLSLRVGWLTISGCRPSRIVLGLGSYVRTSGDDRRTHLLYFSS